MQKHVVLRCLDGSDVMTDTLVHLGLFVNHIAVLHTALRGSQQAFPACWLPNLISPPTPSCSLGYR